MLVLLLLPVRQKGFLAAEGLLDWQRWIGIA